jgi:hypothetical protein
LTREPNLVIGAPDVNHCQRTVQPTASTYRRANASLARALGRASVHGIHKVDVRRQLSSRSNQHILSR